MKLIVGLGNPGIKYAKNRHNIGFWVVEDMARVHQFPTFQKKFKGLFSKHAVEGLEVGLLLPQTYMNDSGESVRAAADFFKILPADITVIHDEIDLPVGKIKIKTGGGDAGHNGLRSITAHLGTPAYQRVRIGVDKPVDKDLVHAHVLSDFSKEEMPAFEELSKKIAAELPNFVLGHAVKLT